MACPIKLMNTHCEWGADDVPADCACPGIDVEPGVGRRLGLKRGPAPVTFRWGKEVKGSA